MSLFYGKGFLINPATWTLSPTSPPAGYVAPQLEKPELVDQEDAYQLLKSSIGLVYGFTSPNDCILKATIDFIPFGATLADAAKSASLPAKGPYGIAGFPVVQVGQFADAWNAASPGAPWFYLGGGTIRGDTEGKAWSMSLPLMRFVNITGAGAWTAVTS